ncbi:MAG: sn-glycerol-1-phosphate dehydrogenase [Clostridiales bacterium]|nr:sn-glycerol-1-phosphate dehydrogenase [Clostridiales bacterium]
MDYKQWRLNDYIKNNIQCRCGKSHKIALKEAIIKDGAIDLLPDLIKKYNYHKGLIVADTNTYKVAGEMVTDLLSKSSIPYKVHIFKDDDLIPDERAVGSVLMAYDKSCDLVIAIGSGTINDIVKFISYKMDMPYWVVGTAPSMDGYISTAAAMTTNHLKTTYETQVPEVFIGDLDILVDAPMPMIAAGFADVMGKFISLQDWRLSHIVNNEYHCETVSNIMAIAVKKTYESGKKLLNRDKDAIALLTEGLLLSGIAMSFVGNSRPASGSEHHLSHFWEMKFQYEGRKPVLHGTKVGIGSIISLKLYEYLRNEDRDLHNIELKNTQDKVVDWEREIKRVYPSAAEDIIKLEERTKRNSEESRLKRLSVIKDKQQEIKVLLQDTFSAQKMESLLKFLGAPINPETIGIDIGAVKDAILYAKELRDRYTILQLLWDLGLLEEYADRVVAYLNNMTN